MDIPCMIGSWFSSLEPRPCARNEKQGEAGTARLLPRREPSGHLGRCGDLKSDFLTE